MSRRYPPMKADPLLREIEEWSGHRRASNNRMKGKVSMRTICFLVAGLVIGGIALLSSGCVKEITKHADGSVTEITRPADGSLELAGQALGAYAGAQGARRGRVVEIEPAK